MSYDNGSNVHQWDDFGNENQRWIITPIVDGYYRIQAKHYGKIIDLVGVSMENGANIHQWEYLGIES
jgi:hypothetical protein